jgi:probable O-glycosylation ligase (exosortase A-associated)
MRDLLVALLVFGSVPFTLVRPYIGILVWTWLSLMSPHRMTYGFAYDLRVAMIVGVTTIAAWLFSREPKRPPLSAPVVLLFLFMVWISVCTVFAINQDAAFMKWNQVIKILAMTFVAMCMLQDRERINQMVWVMAVSLGFYGFRGGIFTVLTGGNYRVWGPPETFIEDNNQLALALVMILPLIWYLYTNAKQRWVQLGLLGAAGCTAVAIAGTYSRGGALGLAIILGYLWLKSRYKVVTFIAAVVVVVGALAFLPEQWYGRMNTIQNYDQDMSVRGRFDAWTFAWRLALERPITGGGFSVFYDGPLFMRLVPEAITFRNAHSIYFEVLGESGFVGLGLFILLGLSSLLTAASIIRLTRKKPEFDWARNLAAMCQVSLVGYASAGAFLNLGFFDLYYYIIALVVVVKAVVLRDLKQAAQQREKPMAPAAGVRPVPAPARA